MRTELLSVFVLMASAALASADDSAVSKEMKSLAGSWRHTFAEQDGKVVPKGELLDISFTLQDDGTADVRVGDAAFRTKSIIDPTKSPKYLDIEYLGGRYKGLKQYGIYKLEGNRWTVFSTPPGGKPEERPRMFDSTTAKGLLVVWERDGNEQ